jgi:hypothetical protein
MASNAGIAGSGLAAAVALSEVSAGIVVGGAAAFLHYSYLKGDLLQMEDAQLRREMEIKELAAKTSELQVALRKLSSDKSSIVSPFPRPKCFFLIHC